MATEPKSGTKFCVVGCKLPHGLELQLYKPREKLAPGETPEPLEPIGDPIILAGSNQEGAVGGFGLTENVDAAAFGEWMRTNQRLQAVRAGLIWAEDTLDKARDKARERAAVLSGFEGLNPEKPPEGVAQGKDDQGRPISQIAAKA